MASASTLLGAAGEYYVMSQLLRRGFIAALAPVGVPNADIIVTDDLGDRLCAIQVKSRRDIGADGGWHMRPARDVLARMQKNSVNLLLIHSGSFAFDAADYGEHFDLLLNAGPGYLYAKKPSSN